MPRLSDVEVSLIVDGVALPEYKIIANGDHEVSCYVPSETGKTFQVSANDQMGDRGYRVGMYPCSLEIDGVKMALEQLREDIKGSGFTIKGLQNASRTTLQPFYFADLQVSEEGLELDGESDALGTISIRVYWLRLHGAQSALPAQNLPTLQNTAVHEKSKKLTTHRVLLGDSVPDDQRDVQMFQTTIEARFPTLTFRFHYANKEILTARDIMPSTKPQALLEPAPRRPKKRTRDTKVTDLEDGEDQAKGKQSRTKRVKTEVQSEPSIGLTPYKIVEGGVIDLTDD